MNGTTDDAYGRTICFVTLTPATQCASGDGEAGRDITPGGTTPEQFGANSGGVSSCAFFGSTLCMLMSRAATMMVMRT